MPIVSNASARYVDRCIAHRQRWAPNPCFSTRTMVSSKSARARGDSPRFRWSSPRLMSALISTFGFFAARRSEEHTSELQSRLHLVCRLLLEKKKKKQTNTLQIRYPTQELWSYP